MTTALALLLAALLVPVTAARVGRRAAWVTAGLLLAAGLLHDAAPVVDLDPIAGVAARLAPLAPERTGGTAVVVGLAALVWCGPAADVAVRSVLTATRVPAPPRGADEDRAGRWIGRLERWLLVVCIGTGQAALAVIPVGGKALFRYAEVVADARSARPQLRGPDGAAPVPGRDTLVDYVIVGSLASWTQAIVLGLLLAAA